MAIRVLILHSSYSYDYKYDIQKYKIVKSISAFNGKTMIQIMCTVDIDTAHLLHTYVSE